MIEPSQLECGECGWIGESDELVCSKADEVSELPVNKIQFNCCPKCGGTDFDDLD